MAMLADHPIEDLRERIEQEYGCTWADLTNQETRRFWIIAAWVARDGGCDGEHGDDSQFAREGGGGAAMKCDSCGSYEATTRRDQHELCTGCAHMVDEHGATVRIDAHMPDPCDEWETP